jgi:DNA-binding NtrC family response regulator
VAATFTRSQLLYIGNDPELSKVSSALLRSAGYRVRATNPLHVLEALSQTRFGAIILCATLSSNDVNLIVDLVKQRQPELPIVSIQVGLLGDGPHPASSIVIDALQGPLAFVGAIKAVAVAHPKAS